MIGHSIMSHLREHLMSLKTANVSANHVYLENHSNMSHELDLHNVTSAKLRYVGGFVIAKLLFRCKSILQQHLQSQRRSSIRIVRMANAKCFLLEEAAGNQAETESSTFPNSLSELEHRRRGKLVCLTERCYLFFIALEKERLRLLTMNRLANTDDLPQNTLSTMLDSQSLKKMWHDIFEVKRQFEEMQSSEDNEQVNVQQILEVACTTAVAMSLLLTDVICLFLRVAHKQFRKEVKTTLQIKKKSPHREQIEKKQKKRNTSSKSQNLSKKPKTTQSTKASNQNRQGADDSDTELCEECGSHQYTGVAKSKEIAWCQCDGCDAWYHKLCTTLTDLEFADVQSDDGVWFCDECYLRMDELYPCA